jgi:hypothetical protein
LKILRRCLHNERRKKKTKRGCQTGHASHFINAPLRVISGLISVRIAAFKQVNTAVRHFVANNLRVRFELPLGTAFMR